MSETILLRDHLDTSIRLRWELTDTRTMTGVRWLSSRARRDPRELSTTECRALIDEFGRAGVTYADIGGGDPTVREDFWELLAHATARRISIGFATSGIRITPAAASAIATSGRVDVRICLDGPTEAANDVIGGPGSYRTAVRAMELLASSGVYDFELSVAVTRHNAGLLDAFLAIANLFGARLRLSLPRSSACGADSGSEQHLLPEQHRDLYRWLRDHAGQVRTGDWFLPLVGDGEPPLNSAVGDGDGDGDGDGVACLVDPIGDVYVRLPLGDADLRAGNVRAAGGFARIWRDSADPSPHGGRLADDLRACS